VADWRAGGTRVLGYINPYFTDVNASKKADYRTDYFRQVL
jgi:hypothetical protein